MLIKAILECSAGEAILANIYKNRKYRSLQVDDIDTTNHNTTTSYTSMGYSASLAALFPDDEKNLLGGGDGKYLYFNGQYSVRWNDCWRSAETSLKL